MRCEVYTQLRWIDTLVYYVLPRVGCIQDRGVGVLPTIYISEPLGYALPGATEYITYPYLDLL